MIRVICNLNGRPILMTFQSNFERDQILVSSKDQVSWYWIKVICIRGPFCVYPLGSIVTALVCPFVCPSVFKCLRDRLLVFPEILHEVGLNKVKKVTQPEISTKNLNLGLRGIQCQQFGFLTVSQKLIIKNF